jgi:PAS domain S-box-containing protein
MAIKSFDASIPHDSLSYTVLIVESLADQELYQRYLLADLACHYTLLQAESVAAAATICQHTQIDGILVDSVPHLPHGLELLQELQRRLNGGHPPIVLIASERDPAAVVQAMKLGAEDYLIRQTLTAEQLQIAMRNAIENARLRLQLQYQEERFRISVENMLDCFGIFSAIRSQTGEIVDFRIDYLNTAAMANNQMTPADIGKGLCELLPAHRESGLFEEYCRVVETGEPLVKEDVIYTDIYGIQQLTRAFDIRVNKLDDGFVASWREVTARKQTEIRLRQANQQLTTIWESITDAYLMLDLGWRFVYANAAAVQIIQSLTNQTPADFLGKTHWEVFPWSVGQTVEREYRRAMTEQITVHFEIQYEPTGTWFEVHAYPSEAGLGIYFRDISARKQTEAIVQQQLAEIEAIYTTTPIGLCFLDPDLRFVRINQQLAEINGLPVSEHLGRTLREILPEIADLVEPLFQEVLASGEPIFNLEVQGSNRAQPGVERHWLVSYYPQIDLNQRVVGVNAMVQEITERKRSQEAQKQAEAALLESERKFRAVFNQTFELMGLIDLQGILLEVNQAALNSIAAEAADVVGKPFWETSWWTSSQQLQTQLKDAVAQAVRGQVVRYEVTLPDPKGNSTMTTDFSLKPVFDEAGQVVMLIAEGRDITERKQAEEALRENESRFQQLAAASPSVIYTVIEDAAGPIRFEYLSPAFETLHEIPIAAALADAQIVMAQMHPDDRAGYRQAIEHSIATLEAFKHEWRIRTPSGKVKWLQANSQPQQLGDRLIWHGIVQDITERKQFESTIQEQLAQIEAIYATAPTGLCCIDRERWFVQVNEQLAAINGLSVAEHMGRTVREVLPELAELQEPIFEQVLQTGEPVLNVEMQGITPAQPGVKRYWLVSYHPLIAAEGEILGINILVQEITERKQDEMERNRLLAEAQAARAEAEAANRSKDEFVALVAHELRSPLNAIMGWSKLLRTRQFDAATTHKALETIIRNTQAQVQLVEDLLDMSRMVRGTLQLEYASVDLSEIVEAASETIRPAAEARELQVQTQLQAIAPLWGDASRLQQVVLNLLTNAVKFTPRGGQVRVLLDQPGAQVRLRVIDTGKGISPEFLPHIFEQFQQDQQSTTVKQGLGLGLAIVKYIVEQHGGTITAASDGEQLGATFTVLLPALQAEVAVDATAPPLPDNSGQSLAGVRVLLVDDAPDLLSLTSFILQQAGATVQTAANAAEALQQFSAFCPEILLSDIAMPGQNGCELLRQVRLLYPEAQIPAIAFTAYANETYRRDSLQAGFQEHLIKPVEPEELVRVILQVLRRTS